MAHPVIDADECIACGVCVDSCPAGVLELQDVATVADEDSCVACGACQDACPAGAITEIVEDTARTAGVTYNTQPLFLKVTVLQAEDGMVRVAAIHLGTEDGDKQAHIANTYSAGTLDVTKTVVGHLGDRSKDFHFTVTLTKQADLCMNSTIGLTVAGVEQRDFAPDWDDNGVCTVSFTLKHGETASLTNLPYGMTYTVTEDDYTAEGYTTAKTGDSGTIAADTVTAAFTNTKGGTVDTGVLLDSAPYVVLLLLAAGGAMLFLRRRIHRS